jgi:hypothetical protein
VRSEECATKGLSSRSSALSVGIDVGDGNLSVLFTSYQWVAVDVHAASVLSMAACGSCIASYILFTYAGYYISKPGLAVMISV